MIEGVLTEQEKLEELGIRMREKWAREGMITYTLGAFGDLDATLDTGFPEEVIKPPEGGTFTKFFGVSYLYKGNPEIHRLYQMGLAKALISMLPREIILKEPMTLLYVLFYAVFFRKRFLRVVWVYVSTLQRHSFVNDLISHERLNVFTRELKRSMDLALQKELVRSGSKLDFKFILNEPSGEGGGMIPSVVGIIACASDFLYKFLEFDSAYRSPAQDILFLLDKQALEKNTLRELNRLFDIAVTRLREAKEPNPRVIERVRYLKWLIFGVLCIGAARRIVKDFLLGLDLNKVKLDEDDWYFNLRRKGYNYGGLSLEIRVAEKDGLDKEKGHILLTMEKKAGT